MLTGYPSLRICASLILHLRTVKLVSLFRIILHLCFDYFTDLILLTFNIRIKLLLNILYIKKYKENEFRSVIHFSSYRLSITAKNVTHPENILTMLVNRKHVNYVGN